MVKIIYTLEKKTFIRAHQCKVLITFYEFNTLVMYIIFPVKGANEIWCAEKHDKILHAR